MKFFTDPLTYIKISNEQCESITIINVHKHISQGMKVIELMNKYEKTYINYFHI